MLRHRLSVSYIDDDPLCLGLVKSYVDDIPSSYQFNFYGSPTQAKYSLGRAPSYIVIVDLRLGSTDGITLIKELSASQPNAAYVLASGSADLSSALKAINETVIFKFLEKPLELHKIQSTLDDARQTIFTKGQSNISNLIKNAVDDSTNGIFLINRDQMLLYQNQIAGHLLKKEDFFQISATNQLQISNTDMTAGFIDFLDTTKNQFKNENEIFIRVTNRRLTSSVTVAGRYYDDGSEAGGIFYLTISDPHMTKSLNANAIAKILDIKNCEARVVSGLIESGNLENAAAISGVSLNTARTYIKSVFNKTGVSKQGELIRLTLLSIPS